MIALDTYSRSYFFFFVRSGPVRTGFSSTATRMKHDKDPPPLLPESQSLSGVLGRSSLIDEDVLFLGATSVTHKCVIWMIHSSRQWTTLTVVTTTKTQEKNSIRTRCIPLVVRAVRHRWQPPQMDRSLPVLFWTVPDPKNNHHSEMRMTTTTEDNGYVLYDTNNNISSQ